MATVIQGQGIAPNVIGRNFGQGLSQGIGQLLQQNQQKEKEAQLFEQVASVLGKTPDQFGGQENVSLLAQILSQNPNAIPGVLGSIKNQEELGQEAMIKRLQTEDLQSKIKERIANTNLLNEKASSVGAPQIKQPKLEIGTDAFGNQFQSTVEEHLASGRFVGNINEAQKSTQQFAKQLTKFRKNEELLSPQTGQVKPVIATYAALQPSSGKDYTNDVMTKQFYPDSVNTPDSISSIGDPNVRANLGRLSSTASEVFKKVKEDLFRDKSYSLDQMPDAISLMQTVSSYFNATEPWGGVSFEEKLRNPSAQERTIKEGDSSRVVSTLSNLEKKLIRGNRTAINKVSKDIVKLLKEGNTTDIPKDESSQTRDLMNRANDAQNTRSGGNFIFNDNIKSRLFTSFQQQNITNPNDIILSLKQKGVPEQQAVQIAREYMTTIQGQ